MKPLNTVPAAILAVLLLGCLVAVYVTRDSAGPGTAPATTAPGDQAVDVDSRLLQNANRLAALAETSDEQSQAREAQQLSDHELDQAFVTALRNVAQYRPPSTGPLRDLVGRINQVKAQIAADQDRIAQLTAQKGSNTADQLELAKAQLDLDQDDLDDAQQDLAREGGDPHSAMERALQEHQATDHQTAQAFKSAATSPTATLGEQASTWFSLRALDRQLLAAGEQASDKAVALAGRHNRLEKQFSPGGQPDAGTPSSASTGDRLATLRRLSDLRKTLTELDRRIQDCQQLAGVYRSWRGLVETRRRAVLRLLLGSLAEILAILLVVMLVSIAIRRGLRDTERRRLHQVRVIVEVTMQLLAVVLILLVVFGVPSQISTIIGLATAGLTVVLRDFIVAFFGWFTLMGKGGIRPGDWVEINGVSGEVIEIGMLKTVLLEVGNWTDTGHPTGRQVAFSNSFAMDGHYFNFSTAGQWLWDELEVTLPAAGDPYLMADAIRKLVERETEADSAQAGEDWERVTNQYGARTFTAKPAVNLRPTVNGLEVVVRYITRAPQRYAMKSKLFQVIVDLLHKPAGTEPAVV